MVAPSNPPVWEDRKIQEWLLLLLRFAVTRETVDRSATLSMADELDSLGMRWRPGGPRFFAKTSHEVCEAILAGGNRHTAILRKHAARIEHPRLRRTFEAAVGLTSERSPNLRANSRKPLNPDLWRGLTKRYGGNPL